MPLTAIVVTRGQVIGARSFVNQIQAVVVYGSTRRVTGLRVFPARLVCDLLIAVPVTIIVTGVKVIGVIPFINYIQAVFINSRSRAVVRFRVNLAIALIVYTVIATPGR